MQKRLLALECIKLTPRWTGKLVLFCLDLKERNDDFFFAPHAVDEAEINTMISRTKEDLYYLVVDNDEILGYGLLRGWDEGYEVPSLGIAINPNARRFGVARFLMEVLQAAARQRGAKKIRLRVRKENRIAINLYQKIGYEFESHKAEDEYLTGVKQILP